MSYWGSRRTWEWWRSSKYSKNDNRKLLQPKERQNQIHLKTYYNQVLQAKEREFPKLQEKRSRLHQKHPKFLDEDFLAESYRPQRKEHEMFTEPKGKIPAKNNGPSKALFRSEWKRNLAQEKDMFYRICYKVFFKLKGDRW